MAVTSAPACAPAAQQTVDGADAGNEAIGAAPADPGDGAHDESRRGPEAPEAPRAVWSPEAVRARRTPGEVGDPPSPEHEYGATTATAPPDAGEVLPGPSVPHGPVPLVSSRRGEGPPAGVATAILDAYQAFWDSYWLAATHPVNPDHPGIGQHSAEPLHSRAVGVLRGRVAEGIALRRPADHGAGRVIHIEGWDSESAEVLDCFVDTAVLYEVSTGRVRNGEQATVVHLALMRRERGAWRVTEVFEQAVHTGRTDGCTMQEHTPAMPPPPVTVPAAGTAHGDGGVADVPQSPS